MDIIKIIGIAFLAVIIILILKQYRPEFAMYVSMLAGALIILMSVGKLDAIIRIINQYFKYDKCKWTVLRHSTKNYRNCIFNRICSKCM